MRRVRVNIKQLKEPIDLFSPMEPSRTIGVETRLGVSDPSRRPWITLAQAQNNQNLYILDGYSGTYSISRQLAERPLGLDQLDILRWLVRLHEMFRHDYLHPDRPLPVARDLRRLVEPNKPESGNAQSIRFFYGSQQHPRLDHITPQWPDDGRVCVSLAMAIALAFAQDNPRISVLPDTQTRFRIVRMASWDLRNTPNPDDIEPHFEDVEYDEGPREEDDRPF